MDELAASLRSHGRLIPPSELDQVLALTTKINDLFETARQRSESDGVVCVNDETAIALNKLIAVCVTCKRRNTPEWMRYFAECINAALAASGSDDRVKWPGSWANEFHLESGS